MLKHMHIDDIKTHFTFLKKICGHVCAIYKRKWTCPNLLYLSYGCVLQKKIYISKIFIIVAFHIFITICLIKSFIRDPYYIFENILMEDMSLV